MSWSAESYQLVAFHPQNESEDAFQVWLSLFNIVPDNFQKHPDSSVSATMANGRIDGFTWQVQCSPGRVDLLLIGQPVGDSVFPTVPDELNALDLIKRKLIQSIANKINIVRLGFVCSYFRDYDTLPKVHDEFAKVTGIKLDSGVSLDATFSVNVRTKFPSSGIELNRVCNWQAIEKQAMKVEMTTPVTQGVDMEVQQFVPNVFQPSLVFNVDINTVLHDSSFDPVEAEQIYAFMLTEVHALKEGGYARLFGN